MQIVITIVLKDLTFNIFSLYMYLFVRQCRLVIEHILHREVMGSMVTLKIALYVFCLELGSRVRINHTLVSVCDLRWYQTNLSRCS